MGHSLDRYFNRFGRYIEIQKSNSADIDHILYLQSAAFPEDKYNITRNVLTDAIYSKEYCVLTARYKSHFAGYVILKNRRFRPWTSGDGLVVKKEYAGKGIGAFLIREAMKQTRRPLIRLFVERRNRGAIRLYRKFGFFKTITKIRHYENGQDALVFMALTWR